MTIATIKRARKVEGPARLLTVADLAALPSELPSGRVRYELNNGRLIVMAPPGGEHGGVEARFVFRLMLHGDQAGLGETQCGEVGIVLWRNPDRVVGADAVFIAKSSEPIRYSDEGYLETIPELVVEVRSKNDAENEVDEKVRDYIAAGVRIVWVADPRKQTVTEHRRRKKPRVFTAKDTLTLDEFIPGFQLPVAEALRVK